MTALFPAMLAGLIGLSVPLILHLIARHRFPVQDFPTIRMLVNEDRTNVLAPKLVDPLQLLLRLLVVALLVAAMSRLYSPQSDGAAAPQNLVVVLDCSASMKMVVPRAGATAAGETSSAGGDAGADSAVADSKDKTVFDSAKQLASRLLARIKDPSQAALVTAEDRAVVRSALQPSGQPALDALDNVIATDGTGNGLVQAVAAACRLVENRREVRSQVVVLTDMREIAFAAQGERELATIQQVRESLGDALDLVIVDLSTASTGNLAVETAYIAGGFPKVGDDAHVLATILNRSSPPEEKKGSTGKAATEPEPTTTSVNLRFGKRRAATKKIALGPGERAVVDLTVRMNRSVQDFVEVSIDKDSFPADDKFSVPLNVVDARRVLIINGTQQETAADLAKIGRLGGDGNAAVYEDELIDGATILRFVLNPGRELGLAYGTGIHTTTIAPDALAGQPLSKFEMIVLYDVSSVPDSALDDIDTFVRQGRSVLIVASRDSNAVKFNESLATVRKVEIPSPNAGSSKTVAAKPLAPARLGNDKSMDPAVGIDLGKTNHPLLEPFRDRLQGDLSIVRFTRIRDLLTTADDASKFDVLIRADNGAPLAVEHKLGQGRVVMLLFGFELERGNIALTRGFPPLMWRLVDYLTGRLRSRAADIVPALTPAVLDVSEPEFAFTTELELVQVDEQPSSAADSGDAETTTDDGTKSLTVSAGQKVVVPPLPAGRYFLRKKASTDESGSAEQHLFGYTRPLYAHVDPQESQMERVSEASIAKLFGEESRIVKPTAQVFSQPKGSELWNLVVMALMIAYFAEAILGWILNQRRERKRLEEAL